MSKTNEQRKILYLYGLFAATLGSSVVPSLNFALISLILFFVLMAVSYGMRTGPDDDSLQGHHATYVLRTVWIGALLSLLPLIVGCIYMLMNVNNAPLNPCIYDFLRIGPPADHRELMAMMKIFNACMDGFLAANKQTFLISGCIAAIPIMLYFIGRFIRGLARAGKGEKVANLKGWF